MVDFPPKKTPHGWKLAGL